MKKTIHQIVANLLINEIRPKVPKGEDPGKYLSPTAIAVMAQALHQGTATMHDIRRLIKVCIPT